MPTMSLHLVLQTWRAGLFKNVTPKCQMEWLTDVFSCPQHPSCPPFINRRLRRAAAPGRTPQVLPHCRLSAGRSVDGIIPSSCIMHDMQDLSEWSARRAAATAAAAELPWVHLECWALTQRCSKLQPLDHVGSVHIDTVIQPGAASVQAARQTLPNPTTHAKLSRILSLVEDFFFFILVSITETSQRQIMRGSAALSECSSGADYSRLHSWCQFSGVLM